MSTLQNPTEHPPAAHASAPQWYERLSRVSLLILLLSFALLGIHAHLKNRGGHTYDFLSELAHEAGFAGLVALFLNLSIEWVNRRRHADQEAALVRQLDSLHSERIATLLGVLDRKYQETANALLKDLFRTVYGRNIDPGVFKIVEDHVLKKELMRKHYKFSMGIRPLLENTELVANLVGLTFDIQYTAVNISSTKYEGTLLSAVIDITPEHESECRFLEARIGDKVYTAEELVNFVEKNTRDSMWVLRIKGEIDVEGQVPVSLRYKKVGPRDYSEVICSTVQMDGMEVVVVTTVKELKVNAVSLHPESERETSLPNPDYMSWRVDHAFLPGQGMVIFWHPKRRDADEA